jgi:hypothetical protein
MNPALLQAFGARLGMTPEQLTALQSGDLLAALSGHLKMSPETAALLQSMQSAQAQTEPPEPEPDLQGALGAAREALDFIAALFGACRCFGQNPDCPTCQGAGTPGWSAPSDPRLLLKWTLPALSHLGLRVVRQTAVSPRSPHDVQP